MRDKHRTFILRNWETFTTFNKEIANYHGEILPHSRDQLELFQNVHNKNLPGGCLERSLSYEGNKISY
ncbi:MAG: hypothetical protein RBG13Loki_2198 [Promethearchaeota archaeon CR_4]|nr:MAG: hypothetical protein RBG13Loki_2198 [Candidatus Lokiarchaeota archaeon CR_4]